MRAAVLLAVSLTLLPRAIASAEEAAAAAPWLVRVDGTGEARVDTAEEGIRPARLACCADLIDQCAHLGMSPQPIRERRPPVCEKERAGGVLCVGRCEGWCSRASWSLPLQLMVPTSPQPEVAVMGTYSVRLPDDCPWIDGRPDHHCSESDAERAVSGNILGWPEMHERYVAYSLILDCDHGAVAASWSEEVARLLYPWDELPVLASLARLDPPFLEFVLRHVGGVTDRDDLERIRRDARHRCPPRHRWICSEIARAAGRALAGSR